MTERAPVVLIRIQEMEEFEGNRKGIRSNSTTAILRSCEDYTRFASK